VLCAIREPAEAAVRHAVTTISEAAAHKSTIASAVALHVNLDKTAELSRETFTA
jgi:hypothetical protein